MPSSQAGVAAVRPLSLPHPLGYSPASPASPRLHPPVHLPDPLPAPWCPRVPDAQTRLTQCKQSPAGDCQVGETAGVRRQRPRWAQVVPKARKAQVCLGTRKRAASIAEPGQEAYGVHFPSGDHCCWGFPEAQRWGWLCLQYPLFSGSGLRNFQIALGLLMWGLGVSCRVVHACTLPRVSMWHRRHLLGPST